MVRKNRPMPMRMDVRKFMEEQAAQEQRRSTRRHRNNNNNDSQRQDRAEAADQPPAPQNQPRREPADREDRGGPSSRLLWLFPNVPGAPAAVQAAAEPVPAERNEEKTAENAIAVIKKPVNAAEEVKENRVVAALTERPLLPLEIVTVHERAARRNNYRSDYRRSDGRNNIDAQRRPIVHVRFTRTGLSQYRAEMQERILQRTRKNTCEPPTIGTFVQDIEFVSKDDRSFKCSRRLIEQMCLFFDQYWEGWTVPSVRLGSSDNATERFVNFARNGVICIDADCVFDLLGISDYLGFECLRRICVHFMSSEDYSLVKMVSTHDHLPHPEGVSEAFMEKAIRIPLALYRGQENASERKALLSMKFSQLHKLLSSDRLMVTREDEVVHMIEDWLKQNSATDQQKQTLLSAVRYQFITRPMGRWLNDSTSTFPQPKIQDVATSAQCGPRAGFDTHVHIMWKEHRRCSQGPQNIAITCVSWNKQIKKLREESLMRVPTDRNGDESRYGIQFAIAGNKLVRTSTNWKDDKIFISEVNLRTGEPTLKRTIRLFPLRIVDRPELTIIKHTSDLSLCYHDSDTEIRTLDTNTFRDTKPKQPVPGSFGMHPWVLQIFTDAIVGLNGSRIVISEPEFKNPITVQLDPTEGRYIDFERVGDYLFVLEDAALERLANQGSQDLIHVIGIEERMYLKTLRLPSSVVKDRHFDDSTPETACKFMRIGSDLFVVQQSDSDMPLRVTFFDVETFTFDVVALLPAPTPDEYNPETVARRQFLSVVPPSFMPCDNYALKDLGLSYDPTR